MELATHSQRRITTVKGNLLKLRNQVVVAAVAVSSKLDIIQEIMGRQTLVNLDLASNTAQASHMVHLEWINLSTHHSRRTISDSTHHLHRCQHSSQFNRLHHLRHSNRFKHPKNSINIWMVFSSNTPRTYHSFFISSFLKLFYLDLSFSKWTNKKKIHSGGSVAQSTPGATAFASSYLGPNKYMNTFFMRSPLDFYLHATSLRAHTLSITLHSFSFLFRWNITNTIEFIQTLNISS